MESLGIDRPLWLHYETCCVVLIMLLRLPRRRIGRLGIPRELWPTPLQYRSVRASDRYATVGRLVRSTSEPSSRTHCFKDPAGKIVALFVENGAGDFDTANSFVYCSKPRHEGQSSARTFEGTPLFMWAGLGPAVSVGDVNNGVSMVLKPIRLTHPNGWLDEQEPHDTRLRWGQFGCYNVAADGVSFESTPSLVLQGKDPFTPVRVTSQIEMGAILDLSCSQGIGFVPVSKDSLTVAAGVDPLMVVLAFLACGIGNGGFLDRRPAAGGGNA